MKITNTSTREKRSNINHIINEAKNNHRSEARHWSWDNQAEANSLKHALVGGRARRISNPDGKWVNRYDGDFCRPVTRDRVSVQPRKPAVFNTDTESKRFRVTVVDKITGDETTVRMRIVTKSLMILCYGKTVEFRKTNRGNNVRDMRTNTLRSPEFVKSEIRRLLPTSAEQAIAELFATE
jgi:hypothetical protein